NVAVDVARMLVTPPEELGRTDMADHALKALGNSKVREVVVLGRRGAAQASFTTPELRELGKLDGVEVVVDAGATDLDPASRSVVEEARTARANLKYLQEYAGRTGRTAPRRLFLRFLASPVEIIGRDGRISGLRVEGNQLAVGAYGGVGGQGG